MKKNKNINSVYIHIPFCKKICSYCDFCKNYYNEKDVNLYLKTLEKEIVNNYKNDIIKTIYVGGGTPSSLNFNELNKLFNILKIFKKDKIVEYTFECNYNDINNNLLKLLKENGVNRLSIGIQTFNKKYEKILNRNINNDEIIKSILLAKNYFNNINVDLMYALPNETIEELKIDINKIINLNVTHISIYSLIIEEHTKLYIDQIKEVNEDIQNDMYNIINEKLTKHNYSQYEISNYSKKGFESKHNLNYWNNENYYGFGLGASGFVDNVRYDNTKSMKNYFNKNMVINKIELSKEDLIEYEIMLNLRKIKGINKNIFKKKYNTDFNDLYDVSDLLKEKYLIEDNENIYIPFKYLFVSNEIILKVLECKKNT